MARRSRSTADAFGVFVAILVFLSSVATLLYLPFWRCAHRPAQVLAVVGIVVLLASLVWWIGTHEHPPAELAAVASLSGGVYVAALVLRVTGMGKDRPKGTSTGLLLGSGEAVLHEASAKLLGRSRARAHVGIGARVLGPVGIGLGLSVPTDDLTVVDEGTLYVTTRRVVFAGLHGTEGFAVNRIAGVDTDGSEGLIVRPSRGRNLLLLVNDSAVVDGALRSAMELAGT